MTNPTENPSWYLYGPETAKIENAPYPFIEDQHDVIVRIAYVGVCGSDVSFQIPDQCPNWLTQWP